MVALQGRCVRLSARRGQGLQQLRGQRARACAKLPNVLRLCGLQRLRHLPRQGAQTGRELRRGDKVAARGGHQPQLTCPAAVVAQTRA